MHLPWAGSSFFLMGKSLWMELHLGWSSIRWFMAGIDRAACSWRGTRVFSGCWWPVQITTFKELWFFGGPGQSEAQDSNNTRDIHSAISAKLQPAAAQDHTEQNNCSSITRHVQCMVIAHSWKTSCRITDIHRVWMGGQLRTAWTVNSYVHLCKTDVKTLYFFNWMP